MSESAFSESFQTSFCSSIDERGASYLLPCKLSSATKRKQEDDDANEMDDVHIPAGKRKRRLGPEYQQLESIQEMHEALTAIRTANLRLMMLLTKIKLNNKSIREKTTERAAKLRRKRLRKLAKVQGNASSAATATASSSPHDNSAAAETILPVAYFEIKPELASLLNIPAETYVRRQDISSLISSYARKQNASEGSFQVTPELRAVIGDQWSEKIQSGAKTFNSFTFNEIAKERQLFVRRAPTPSNKQALEIYAAMGYDLSKNSINGIIESE